jgi:hypothetical protein
VVRYRCAHASLGLALVASLLTARPCQSQYAYERPPINYLSAQPHDPVAQLQEDIRAGQKRLEYRDRHGYLTALLDALEVDTSSQVLVFSKTSFQQTKISARRPRALYFNDSVYVGWVQHGDVIEISSADPQLGAVFYTLNQQPDGNPRFERQTHNCLTCHAASHTGGVPGHFVRSVYADRSGRPLLSAGSFRTDYTSPLRERWGGWYVSGEHGSQRHMGNVIAHDRTQPEVLDVDAGANVTDLSHVDTLDIRPYLTPHSDLVALLVLEHQIAMQNALAAANYNGRITLRDAKVMNEALERPLDYESESTRRRLDSAAERVVDVLLFCDEHKLAEPVRGTSQFAARFEQRGPFDSQGRSLRELDLQTRLLRYPCSYLIYSDAFDALPAAVHERVLSKLYRVLTGDDTSPRYQHLSPEDRQAILRILRESKDPLPPYWQ